MRHSNWILAASLVGLWSCSDETTTTPEVTAEKVVEQPVVKAPAPVPEVKGPPLSEIVARVAKSVVKVRAKAAAPVALAVKAAGPDAEVLKFLYSDPQLRFYLKDGNLSDDGEEVMAILQSLDRHGVDRRGYRLAQIDAATEAVVIAFKVQREAILALGDDPAAAQVAEEICRWVRTGKGGEIRLVRAGGDKLNGLARKTISEQLDAIIEIARKASVAMWQADLEIARATIRYVVDFKFAIVAHPYDVMTPSTVRNLSKTKAKEIQELFAKTQDKMAPTMRALWPTHPQYAKLLKAVDSYLKLATDSAWEKLPKLPRKKVTKGFAGPWIVKLRGRLAAEGYEVEPEGSTYDEALVAQVTKFQGLHQLKEDGVIGKSVVRELNVLATHRARELGLSLQRLREAQARDPADYFIWVNISAQQMQVIEKNKVLRTHRVIVGKDNEDIDFSAKIKGKINRTKMFTAKMTKITLAPRWYPTPRVVDIELGPALAKDPDYYEKEGYVSEMGEDGSETVYQRSGPTNLLGRVKFQFPNKHSIYMHDTPGRSLFKRPRRAYSHGCIRLHKPLQLAYYLLGREHRRWNKKRVRETIDEREEKIVFLKKKFLVHIDYVSATVEKGGKVHFWSDIYGYDAAYFTGQMPVEDTEEYEPKTFAGIR